MQPTRARHVTLAYLCGLTLILYLDRMCMGKAAPFIQNDLGLSNSQMGWIHAAFTIAYGLFELPTGHLGDRFGSRNVLLRIVLWWSAFTVLTGATTGFWMLFAVRFLFGAGEAGALPNASRVIDRWFPPAGRGKIRGLVHTPALLGAVIAPLGTAYLIEWIGWRWTFALFGMLGVVWAAGFARWFRELPADHPKVNAAERDLIGPPPESVANRHDGLPFRAIFGNRNIWLLGSVLSAGSGTVYLLFSWYPTYLERIFRVSNVTAGWLSAAVMLGGAVGCVAGGWIVDRLSGLPLRWRFSALGCGGFGFAALAVLCSAFVDSAGGKTLLLALGCFGIHLHAGAWWGANTAIGGRHSGATFAVINSIGVLAGAAAQLGFGFLDEELWSRAFVGAGLLLACGATCWSLVDPRRGLFETDHKRET
jgi:MFS transporter, ACS family, glucarate transporter